jgi:uncharacterized membrane protein
MGWGFALMLVWGWLVLVISPPFLGEAGAWVVTQALSLFCHQLPDRTLVIDGTPLAVCHRCLGIYAALAVAAVAYVVLRRYDSFLGPNAGWVLAASVVPPGVDWFGGVVDLWPNTPATRMATGAVFGIAAGYYLARAFADLFSPSPSSRVDTGEPANE